MSKRHHEVRVTPESEALKRLRLEASISTQKLGDRLGLSKVRVSQMENGRANITEEYVDSFLEALNLKKNVWIGIRCGATKGNSNTRDKCHKLIDLIDEDKLQPIIEMLKMIL